jgi:Rps23 Pro-64 3,4-dihydroxylase Tpa1-like proline 4-hydroxylase
LKGISALSILECFDDLSYPQLAVALAEDYANAHPYQHVVIDDFLPNEVAIELAKNFPRVGIDNLDAWKSHDNENVIRWLMEDSSHLPMSLREFAAATSGRTFLQFLATLTGMKHLIADPYLMGGGAMMTARGGFLDVHADFNWHAPIQAWRRVNALFYLTPDWERGWGGNLELWSLDGCEKIKSVEPRFNRVVIFSTRSDTFHGQPTPLTCPSEVSRNIFSAFYYTTESVAGIESDPHFTKYALDKSPYGTSIFSDYGKPRDWQNDV